MSEFAPLLEEFLAYWWRTHPTAATAAGIHAHDGELERYDPATLAEVRRQSAAYLEAFERHAPRDTAEVLDLELVTGQLRWQLYELDEVATYRRNPLLYLEAPLGALYLTAVRDYAPAEDRARAATERLIAMPALLDQARENLTEVAPVLARTASAMARNGVSLCSGLLPLQLGSALEDDPGEFARWENALRGAEAALISFATWLDEEVAPVATGDFAIGEEAFLTRNRCLHGLTDTIDELLDYAAHLKSETERELNELARELDRGSGWREIVEQLKDDHPPAEGLIEAYATAVERAREFVEWHGLVEIPPGESLEITATPDYLRPLIPYAAYLPPAPFEVDQRGFFFVTLPDEASAADVLRDHPTAGIAVTALHEAYPGHHLQLTWSNQAPNVTGRVFQTPVFAEGWALYCEELMWEEGFYAGPEERFLQLRDLLWRACRIIVDVGLHTRGWTTDAAVRFLVDEAGLEPVNARIEVDRYCAEPTQPLSYAIGKREIMRLRDHWRAQTGATAPLRQFHDQLLRWGTIPVWLVGEAMGVGGGG